MGKLDKALAGLRDFILSLSSNTGGSDETAYEIFFNSFDYGGLELSGSEAIMYRQSINAIIEAAPVKSFGVKAIERMCQMAILKSLDINGREAGTSLENRVNNEIESIKQILRQPPQPFHVYWPVEGLSKEGLPANFGKLDFCILTQDDFKELAAQRNTNETAVARLVNNAESLYDVPLAKAEILANTSNAAMALAYEQYQLTLDVLNFYSDLLPHFSGHLYLPSERHRLNVDSLIIPVSIDSHITFNSRSMGPLMLMKWALLEKTGDKRQLGLCKVSEMLQRSLTDLEEKLISAMRLSGKATAQADRDMEQAFLLYVIALESVVLIDNIRYELQYRLKTRVAHILGDDLDSRKKIFRQLSDLYSIRSKIVHTGNGQVTKYNLDLIRYFAKSVILVLLTREPFSSMISAEQLQAWFKDELLSGTCPKCGSETLKETR